MIVTEKKSLFNSDEKFYFTRPPGQNTDPREIGARAEGRVHWERSSRRVTESRVGKLADASHRHGDRTAIRQIIAEGRRLSKTQQTQRTQRTKKLRDWKIVRTQMTRIAF
jgi:hypothetical protein